MLLTTILCSLCLLIGQSLTSTAPPTSSHVTPSANQNTTGHYPTSHSTDLHHSGNTTHGNHSGNHTDGDHHEGESGHHAPAHIHVFTVDFTHVKYPCIFGLVVILAGLSKIGKYQSVGRLL